MVNYKNISTAGARSSYLYGRTNINNRYHRNATNAALSSIFARGNTRTTTQIVYNTGPSESFAAGTCIGAVTGFVTQNWNAISNGVSKAFSAIAGLFK
jgi:hypothetical protein